MTRITKAAKRLRPEFAANLDAYSWLSALPPGLMLDVGAAAGTASARMLEFSPKSRVVAFEPFPGNHPFIDKKLGADARVVIVKQAVSNNNDPASFFVESTITHGTGKWAGMEGYSSGGMIIAPSDPRAQKAITVPTCRLDDTVSEPVRFLKIDVQGGEGRVLDGARKLFDDHGVELVLAEFQGDKRVLRFLAKRGYAIFDSKYLSSRSSFDPVDWHIVGKGKLSSGKTVHTATPKHAPESPGEYASWFKQERKRYGSFWTDLIAVAPWSQLLQPQSIFGRSLDWLRRKRMRSAA
jgi:FkbM family methyltransferase